MSVAVSVIDALADVLWTFLGSGLIHGTVLAAITWFLSRTVLRRARPALMTALWTIVLVKFLVPIGPEMPLSLSGLLDAFMAQTGQGSELGMAGEEVAGEVAGAASGPSASQVAWAMAQAACLVLYFVLAGMLLYRRISAQRAHRRQAEALPAADRATELLIERAARTVALKRIPTVRMSGDVISPRLIGLIRPILVVPTELAAHQPETFEATLLHELAHVRRGDTWLRGLQLVAATFLFFWPVVRWVNRCIDDYREMTCDQWAITWGRLSPGAYARALVDIVKRSRSARADLLAGSGLLLGMAMIRGRKQLEVRIEALMRGRTRPRVGLFTGAGLAAWALVSLGGAAQARVEVSTGPNECVVQPGIVEYILANHPEADMDGNGELSLDEVCAHQKRLREKGEGEASPERISPDAISRDPMLVSLDSGLFDCQACGCMDDEPSPESRVSFDRKICLNE